MDRPPEQGADASATPADAARDASAEALRRLARSGDASPPDQPAQSTPTANVQRARPGAARGARRALMIGAIIVIVIILVAVVATLVAHFLQPAAAPTTHQKSAPHAMPHAIQIAPLADGLNCPVDIAWSPDGAHIALLGYQDHCPNGASGSGASITYTSGLLLIFNAKTGTLTQRASLDPLVTGGGLTLDTQTQYLAYQALMWSPDGTRLALPFFAQSGAILPTSPVVHGGDPTIEPHPTTAGVLLLDTKTLQRTALLTAPYSAPASGDGAPEWNLITGKMFRSALQLPPAVGYHWGAGGALLPDDAVNATQAPAPVAPAPVGNPVGGASFSVWQAGETALGGSVAANGTFDFVPGVDLFYARFGAWSPDGAYLLAPTYFGGRIDTFQPPQPTAAQVASTGFAAAALFPARDAALAGMYDVAPKLDISWSPDGKTLAVWNGEAIVGATQLGLYNATSGGLQSSLPMPAAADGQLDTSPNVTDMLRWSPDGKRLALMSVTLSSLVIWQV